MMTERFFSITFPEGLVKEPVLYSLVQRYDLSPNVYRASVTSSGGWLVVKLSGLNENVEMAVLDLKCRGAHVAEGKLEDLDSQNPVTIRTIRARLKVPKDKIEDPVLSELIKNHDVVTNIRQAKVDKDNGVLDLEISGTLEAIDAAMESLKFQGVSVDPIEGNVIE